MRRFLWFLGLCPVLALAADATIAKLATAPVANTVSCATTATAVPATPLAKRVSLCIYNEGAATVYLGPSGVTAATGWPLAPGAAWCDDVRAQAYYCIVSSGTNSVRYLEN